MRSEPVFKSPVGRQAVLNFYDRMLDAWPTPYETHTIPTRHGETYVITSGDPAHPPLILLHGAGTNSVMWAGDVATYAAHFCVHAVDLIGEPGRSAPTRPPYEEPAFAEWLDDVRTGLKIDHVTLVGISQGGWIALKFATMYPEHVAALVLLAPAGIVKDRASVFLRILPLALCGEWGMRRIVRRLWGDQPVPQEAEDGSVLMLKHFNSRVEMNPRLADDDLRRLTMPLLLIGGDKDVFRDLHKIAARLQALVPQVAVEIFPGMGHAVVNVAPRVVRFLTQTRDPILA